MKTARQLAEEISKDLCAHYTQAAQALQALEQGADKGTSRELFITRKGQKAMNDKLIAQTVDTIERHLKENLFWRLE